MRNLFNINKGWKFIQKNIKPENYKNEKFKKVNIPHTWNNLDGQDGGSDYYRGSCWYYKQLGKINHQEHEVVYLEFEGVHSICDIYLNGKKIGHHEGGFSTFRVRIDEHLAPVVNDLLIKVDNAPNDTVYPQMADFTFFGGIYRNVNLIITNETHFDLDYFGGPGIMVTPRPDGNDAKVSVEAFVTNFNNESIKLDIYNESGVLVSSSKGSLTQELIIRNASLWHGVEHPYLYTLEASIIKNDIVVDNKEIKFGVRSFSIDPNEGFILNGIPYHLHGVSRHQDRFNKGWAISCEDHEEDMRLIKEVGATTIRLAHYQHDQYFYDLCDKEGMVIWAEIPYISSHMVNGNDNVVSQMKELVVQNYNHPSIVVWGLSNEITMSGENEDLINRHKELNALVHQMDKTRLTTMAQVSMLDIASPMNQISDVLSYNHYFGWYGGEFTDNEAWFDNFHSKYPNRAIGVSEYGCEAVLKWHNSNPQQGDYSEEYQCMYHQHMLQIFSTRRYLWATHVWNMFDFAADARDEGGVQGRNNKGLVTYDRKTKKDSYYLYQAYWTTKPMLHIASKRYVYRNEDTTKVVVYSNNSEVSLYANNKLIETKKGSKVFTFEVPLAKGKTKIKAISNGLVDNLIIVKTTEPYKAYSLESAGGVVNWFDKDGKQLDFTYNRDYFCIKDKIKEIMAHPEGKALIEGMIKKFSENMGGEVAGFKISPAMMKMMGGFSIDRIAKMVPDKMPAEMVYEVNQALQQIKKD